MRATEAQNAYPTTESCDDLSVALERVFNDILVKRMGGVPVVNVSLSVQAIGFKQWQDHFVGVMATPWFMNLMVLPAKKESMENYNLGVGNKFSLGFPGGCYEFTLGYEADIGSYGVCSLFSPMFDFADDQAVLETGQAVCLNLFEADQAQQQQDQQQAMANYCYQLPTQAELAPNYAESEAAYLNELQHLELSQQELNREASVSGGKTRVQPLGDKGLSRRALLTGGRRD